MRWIPAALLLIVCTAVAGLLCLVVSQVGGPTAAYAALSIGLFNSIMFPTIFTLTLERSTAPTSATSGLLVFGIIGGALLPQIAARVADAAGAIAPAFIVPMLGYAALVVFAIACFRTRATNTDAAGAVSGH
jgi:FHS family L-fucose permease-like MFS transporter